MSAVAPPEPILQIGPTVAASRSWGPAGFRRQGFIAHVTIDDLTCILVSDAGGGVKLTTSMREHPLMHPVEAEELGNSLFRAAWRAVEVGGDAQRDVGGCCLLMANGTDLFVRPCEVGGSLRVGLFVSGPEAPHDFLPLYPIEAFGLAFRLWRMASPPEAEAAADAAQEAA